MQLTTKTPGLDYQGRVITPPVEDDGSRRLGHGAWMHLYIAIAMAFWAVLFVLLMV